MRIKKFRPAFSLAIGLGILLLASGCNSLEKKMEVSSSKNVDNIRKEALQEWKNMKFGMFIHWGIYSIPAGVWDGKQIEKLGEQIQRHARIPHEEYIKLAGQFNPVKFNADSIVLLAKNTGMKYIVLTAKHHDGFCMFGSEYTDFDILDASPYGKDILKELADACKKHGIKLGIYYSTPDWHFNAPNPEVNPADNKISVFSKVSEENADYQVNQLEEILSNYGDIVELFFDMGEPTYEQSEHFANIVHETQPRTVINGRIMNNQGDFITMPDNHVPDIPIDTLAWETPGTFYHTWGYKSWVKGDPLEKQIKKQVRKLSQIAARGGNFLLNIGPKADGSVAQYEKDVLAGIGDWMKVNNEAIYNTGTSPFVKLEWGEATTANGKLYLHVFNWPKDNQLIVPGLSNEVTGAYALNNPSQALESSSRGKDKIIDLSLVKEDDDLTVIVVEYKGGLNIEPVYVTANENNEIIVEGASATKHGKYGRESYRSILKDYYRSWNIFVAEPGEYKLSMTYKMKYDEKDFKVELAGQSLAFKLLGNGMKKEGIEMLDGNELAKEIKTDLNGKMKKVEIGVVFLTETGPFILSLKQGQNFEFKSTSKEFNLQDQKYRSMNIEVGMLVLERLK
ncbi:MAG: alpha-L-fucosidase [Bacteroidales bacterium]|nr:alpha-L-fucosidase [Bacteroidales bacterium]